MHIYAEISIQRSNGWVTKCKRLGILKPPFLCISCHPELVEGSLSIVGKLSVKL